MYPALIKHRLARPSAFQLTRLARAPVHVKTQSNTTKKEEYFVNTAFPDDYEGSPLRPEDLEKREAVKEETAEEKKATTAAHRADIYESLFPPDPNKKAKKDRKDPQNFEQEPSLDEM